MARSTRALASLSLNQRGREGYPGVRKTSCPWMSYLEARDVHEGEDLHPQAVAKLPRVYLGHGEVAVQAVEPGRSPLAHVQSPLAGSGVQEGGVYPFRGDLQLKVGKGRRKLRAPDTPARQ
jgi:hypothetical protein